MVSDQSSTTIDEAAASESAGGIAGFISRYHRIYQITIWSVVVVAVAGGTAAWLGGWLDLQDVGYWGVFVVNMVGSAAVVVPVPGLFAVCAGAAPDLGLNVVLLAISGATGSTIGELTGYLAGYGSKGATQKSRYYLRIHRIVEKRGGIALFVLAAIPNPIFLRAVLREYCTHTDTLQSTAVPFR